MALDFNDLIEKKGEPISYNDLIERGIEPTSTATLFEDLVPADQRVAFPKPTERTLRAAHEVMTTPAPETPISTMTVTRPDEGWPSLVPPVTPDVPRETLPQRYTRLLQTGQISPPKERDVGLAERGIKGFMRKFAAEPIVSILSKGGGRLDTALQMQHEIEAGRDPFAGIKGVRTPFDILRPSVIRQIKEATRPFEERTQAKAARSIGAQYLATPPPTTIPEKAVEVTTGVTAFISKIALTKKLLGGSGLSGDVAAWEAVNIAEGGTPGAGASMRLALAGISKIPAQTRIGEAGKVLGQSGLLAGVTAAGGGTGEEVMVAALIPLGMKALQIAAKKGRTNLENRAARILRVQATQKGVNLKKVPDETLKAIIRITKEGAKLQKQFRKGKLSPEEYNKQAEALNAPLKSIFDAIGKTQPPKAKPPIRPAITPKPKPPVTPKPTPGIVEKDVGKPALAKPKEAKPAGGTADYDVVVEQQIVVGGRTQAEPVQRTFTVRAKSPQAVRKAVVDAGHSGEIVSIEKVQPAPAKPEADLPSSEAQAYKQPHLVQKNPTQDIQDAKRQARAEPGFLRIPQLSEFKAMADKLKTNLAKLNNPERDVVRDAFGAIEKWRAETNYAGLLTDWSKQTLKALKITPKELDTITHYMDNPSQYKAQFDALPQNAKDLAAILRADFDEMGRIAKEAGVLDTWIEDYITHIYKDNPKTVFRVLYPQGGKLGTKFRFAKQRKIPTLDDAKRLGLHPITDPILLNSVYKNQLYKTIANRNLIRMLKALKREDGLPLIMGRPRNPAKLRVWDNEYEWVNVPALKRFMYVGEAKGKPLLVKMNAKADPEAAKILNNAFGPWQPVPKIVGAYRWLRGKAKRLIMYNPLIHGSNITSDVMDEVSPWYFPLRLGKAIGTMRRGSQLYKRKDAIVERMVKAGVSVQMSYGLARDLRLAMKETPAHTLFSPISKLEAISDELLWEGMVRNAQIGLFESLTKEVGGQHPDWTQERIDKVIATHINTLLGTLPHTWFSEWGRKASSIAFFARNWTVSNADLVVRAVTGGRKGLGVKALSPEEKTRLGKLNARHLAKGIYALVLFANLLQAGFILVTNALKKKEIIKGRPTPLHTTFQNENWKHWIDVDTGLKNNKGQTIYLVPPFFRYIRDYWGYATQPAKTLYNKLEPVMKNAVEAIVNYSVWQHKQISDRGAPTYKQVLQRAEYFVKGITPSALYAGRPGEVPTWFEWAIPFTGTWIRRGAPGGKYTSLIWEYRTEKGYEKLLIDHKIDEQLQRGEFGEALQAMIETGRYSTSDGMADRIAEFAVPLNHYWNQLSEKEKTGFLKWLEERGYSQKGFLEEKQKELSAIEQRPD